MFQIHLNIQRLNIWGFGGDNIQRLNIGGFGGDEMDSLDNLDSFHPSMSELEVSRLYRKMPIIMKLYQNLELGQHLMLSGFA